MKKSRLSPYYLFIAVFFASHWLTQLISSEEIPFQTNAKFVSDQVIVQYKSGIAPIARQNTRRLLNAIRRRELKMPGAYGKKVSAIRQIQKKIELITLPQNLSVTNAIAALKSDPSVEFAEPNWLRYSSSTSNDRYYQQGVLWGMYGDRTSPANQYGSQSSEVWINNKTGSNSVYVGVIDSGIQYDHPDLAQNIWTNPYDPVDGIDNDGNGYVDDIHGWDVRSNDNNIYDGGINGTADQHGTHVAGTIGARGGNRIGVAGIAWKVTIIPCKFMNVDGYGTAADAIECINYLTDLKLRHGLAIVATNNSWGGGGFSQAELDAINRAGDAGILFVAAAGNGDDYGNPVNNDVVFESPVGYECTNQGTRSYDCIIGVAALTENGTLANFSNYGAKTVDLAAPGVGIYSTLPYNRYGALSGTSMAAPHVTGAIALYAASHLDPVTGQIPEAGTIRKAILESVSSTTGLIETTVTGGRLNVFEALSH